MPQRMNELRVSGRLEVHLEGENEHWTKRKPLCAKEEAARRSRIEEYYYSSCPLPPLCRSQSRAAWVVVGYLEVRQATQARARRSGLC